MKTVLLEVTASTNEVARQFLSAGEDLCIIAKRQTGGRGTKGRSFLSGLGGVYLTELRFYNDFPASRAFELMARAAVAVCRTAARFGVKAEIKWPNDICAGGRKLAGILIENVLNGDRVRASITGIGLNADNDVSSLGGIAVSLSELAARDIGPEEACGVLLSMLEKESSFEDYLSHVGFLGREITVLEGERSSRAVARRILPDGRLEIVQGDTVRALSAAEITVRL